MAQRRTEPTWRRACYDHDMTSTREDHPHSSELPPPRTEEVARGVFAYIQPDGGWWINNTGFIVGPEAVVCIDSCATERRTRALRQAIDATVTRFDADRPVGVTAGSRARLLVNTHHHGDHTNGNCLLPGTTVIGHHSCRDAIVSTGIMRPHGLWDAVDWGELEPAPPFVTFAERLDIHVGGLRIELHHFGTAAHTTNDVVAWLPGPRVLFTGDLVFHGGTPFVVMGSVAGSLVSLDHIAELDVETLVPGHGMCAGPRPSTPWGPTCACCRKRSPTPSPPGSPLWRPPAGRTWAPSPSSPTPNDWREICTAPWRSAPAPGRAHPIDLVRRAQRHGRAQWRAPDDLPGLMGQFHAGGAPRHAGGVGGERDPRPERAGGARAGNARRAVGSARGAVTEGGDVGPLAVI